MMKIEDIIKRYKKDKGQFRAKEILKLYELQKPKGLFDIKGYKYKLMNKYYPLSVVLINMELSNGKHTQFIVRIVDGGFVFDNGFYIVDDELKYYVESAKMYCFDYHEELCFPIKRKINIKNYKDVILQNDVGFELVESINPKNVQNYLVSDVIKKLLAGAELENTIRFLKLMSILILIASSISALILVSQAL